MIQQKNGYQALDLGNFDIEYELYIRNTDKSEEFNNKYISEINNGKIENTDYLEQIEQIIK